MGGVTKGLGKAVGGMGLGSGIGQSASAAIGPLAGMTKAMDLGAIKSMLDNFSPGSSGEPKITSLLGGVSSTLAAQYEKTLVGAVLKQDTGAAFNAILLATVDKVNGKPNFNLEVEINDLLVKLGNLRDPALPPHGPSPSSVGVTNKVQEAMKSLTDALTAAQGLAQSAAASIR